MSSSLIKNFTVSGATAALRPNAVKAFRQCGLLVVRDFFNSSVVNDLSSVCKMTAIARGEKVYPGVDRGPEQQKIQLKREEYRTSSRSSSSSSSSSLHQTSTETSSASSTTADANDYTVRLTTENKRQNNTQDAQGKKIEYVEVNIPVKTQKKVNKLYNRLMRRRDKYYQTKSVKNYLTPEEERTGKVTSERMEEIAAQIEEAKQIETKEEMRDSSKLEKEFCARSHINDTIECLENFGKAWNHVWLDSVELTRLIKGEVGLEIGKVAETLSGEPVIRLFSDFIQESHAFTNASPFSVFGQMNNFSSSTAMVAIVGLNNGKETEQKETHFHEHNVHARTRYAALPGSHAIMREITKHGQDYSRLSHSFIFDTGRNLRSLPELHHLPIIEFSVDANTVVFVNVLTLMASFPVMTGSAASPFVPLTSRNASCPDLYALSLMPDRCAFDGLRRGWHAADSHGPLYKYERGQLLNDDDVFPVLYRGLDIE